MDKKPIWAPWRSQYVGGEKEPGCVFCNALEGAENPANLVLAVGEQCFVVLNRFPYTTGHLMVLPKRHLGAFEELSAEEWAETGKLAASAKGALDELYGPDGYNMGLNLGEAAGAGIADHLHLHLVPRWQGDNNFMPVTADVRVMSHHLEAVYSDLKEKMRL